MGPRMPGNISRSSQTSSARVRSTTVARRTASAPRSSGALFARLLCLVRQQSSTALENAHGTRYAKLAGEPRARFVSLSNECEPHRLISTDWRSVLHPLLNLEHTDAAGGLATTHVGPFPAIRERNRHDPLTVGNHERKPNGQDFDAVLRPY